MVVVASGGLILGWGLRWWQVGGWVGFDIWWLMVVGVEVVGGGGGCGGKRRNREGRERRFRGEKHNKILLFFYITVNSAILGLELYCSSIAKKFAIVLYIIL